MQAEDF